MTESSNSDSSVNLAWELLPLAGDHPSLALYAQITDLDQPPEWLAGERTDKAWLSLSGSMFSAPPKVSVTPDELDQIADFCRRFAGALRTREEQR